MRNSWTDLTMYLLPTEKPKHCVHTDTVSYSLPGYLTEDGHGFSLHFVPAHLPSLRALVQALEMLAAQPDAQNEAEDHQSQLAATAFDAEAQYRGQLAAEESEAIRGESIPVSRVEHDVF